MTKEINAGILPGDGRLDAIIEKNTRANRWLFFITFSCLMIGIGALLFRQGDLTASNAGWQASYTALQKSKAGVELAYLQLSDSLQYAKNELKRMDAMQADWAKAAIKVVVPVPVPDTLVSHQSLAYEATNISITPVNKMTSGKEKTDTATKKIDKLVVSFDIANNLKHATRTDLYIAITGPDGKLITADQLGSGTFTTRDGGEQPYTLKIPVEFVAAKKKTVSFSWKQGGDIPRGNFKIEIYQDGKKIGSASREIKKGGLFG